MSKEAMQELIREVDAAMEILKDFNTFAHLFSKDTATETLAKLHRTVGNIGVHAKLATFKEVSFPEDKPIFSIFLPQVPGFVSSYW